MAVDLTKRGLSRRDRAILDFERSWWKYDGRKVVAIRERFGLTEPRYYVVLNRLIDRPEAMAQDPFTVKRLQHLRDRRRAQRSARLA